MPTAESDLELDIPDVAEDLIATHGPFNLTKTGATPTRQATFEEWAAAVKWSQDVEKAASFWLGDLVEYGEAHYGEKYSQALEATRYAEKTLRNTAYVARSIPAPRRRENVPFALHAEVAPLPAADQERWLDRVESEEMTREQLRNHIRAEKAETTGTPIEILLIVSCDSLTQQESLAEELRGRGLAVKATTKDA